MKLIFTNFPFSREEMFIFGLESQDAVDEFLQLFDLTAIDKYYRCQFPDENDLSRIKENLRSQELKNILTKYVGKEILVLPEKDDNYRSEKIHYARPKLGNSTN